MSQFLVENFSALSFFLLLFYCFCFSVVAADFLFSFSHFFRVGHWLSCCCWRLCSLAMVFSSNSLPPYHLHSRTHWDSLFSPGLWCFFSLQYWILYVWNLLNHFFTGSFFFFFCYNWSLDWFLWFFSKFRVNWARHTGRSLSLHKNNWPCHRRELFGAISFLMCSNCRKITNQHQQQFTPRKNKPKQIGQNVTRIINPSEEIFFEVWRKKLFCWSVGTFSSATSRHFRNNPLHSDWAINLCVSY